MLLPSFYILWSFAKTVRFIFLFLPLNLWIPKVTAAKVLAVIFICLLIFS